jgi:hypothetical protein
MLQGPDFRNTKLTTTRTTQRLACSASHVDEVINSHPAGVLVAISAIYFGLTITLSSIKLLWLDEFITFYITKLGSLRAIWEALARGADPNPPLNYLLVLISTKLFGEGALALRLPALLASWAGIVALYFFLKRRVPPVYAVCGVLFFMATAAFDYSFESRSYALLLGFSALSLVAWRGAIEGNHRTLSSIGLGVVLAAGLSSNYFAVLAFFPIAAGELLRDLKLRKIEWRVWIALAAASSVVLLYLPLINKAVATFSPYAWNKVEFGVIADSYMEMVEVILWPGIAFLVVGLLIHFLHKKRPLKPVLPSHETLATFMLMAYPFLAYGIARIRGGMLSPRFVIPMCYGFAIAVSVIAYRLFRRWNFAGPLFLLLLVSWVFAREGYVAKMYYDQQLALYRVIQALPSASTIAVTDSLLVLPLHRYAPPEIASRIAFPVDFDSIRQYKKEDSPEQNLWNGRHGIYPVPIMPLKEFVERTPNYLIAAPENNWLVQKLAADGNPPRELDIDTDTKDIQGFTPLCHGPVWFFEEGNTVPTGPVAYERRHSIQPIIVETHENAR